MMKKIIKVTLTTAILASPLQALAEWDTCSILKIGAKNTDQIIIKVNNCNKSYNNNKWMRIVNQPKESYATVLTAFALGKKINIGGDFQGATTNANPSGNIDTIYVDS